MLTKYILFDRIKYSTLTDGGFLHRSKLQLLAKTLDINYNTIRKGISDFKKLGWMERTFTGWNITSWKTIKGEIEPLLTKIKFKETTKEKLVNTLTHRFITQSLKRQVFNVYSKYHTNSWLKNKTRAIQRDESFSMSVRSVVQCIGYKSASTGSKIEHRLKKLDLLSVFHRNEKVCTVEDYGSYLKGNPEMTSYCFVKEGIIYRRLCNNLIPISKNNKLKDFLQKANIEKRLHHV